MLNNTDRRLKGTVVKNHVIIDVIDEDAHFWSPQLNFRIEENEENPKASIAYGIIGPRPTVWTMFMFIYFGIGLLGFVAFSYGFSKYLIGEWSNLIWALPAAILFMLTAYKAGKFGEKLGEEQVEYLKDFVREALMLKKG